MMIHCNTRMIIHSFGSFISGVTFSRYHFESGAKMLLTGAVDCVTTNVCNPNYHNFTVIYLVKILYLTYLELNRQKYCMDYGYQTFHLAFLYRYKEADVDCSKAIALDNTYSKAFARRGTARAALGMLIEAKEGIVC